MPSEPSKEIPVSGERETWKVTPPCCSVWNELRTDFGWMIPEGSPHIRIMPYIIMGGTKWRVNYCPSCGAERRGVVEVTHG